MVPPETTNYFLDPEGPIVSKLGLRRSERPNEDQQQRYRKLPHGQHVDIKLLERQQDSLTPYPYLHYSYRLCIDHRSIHPHYHKYHKDPMD
ncbi:hypothetical protein D3C73_1235140 [compost metagenome]